MSSNERSNPYTPAGSVNSARPAAPPFAPKPALGSRPALTLAVTSVPALSTSARCDATLLFADLSGYSTFTEEREIELVSAVIGEIKRQAVHIVHTHGGIVNQFVGDEVMALFGFPKGQSDAPARAIAAALELHELVRSMSPDHWLGDERQLQMHSGIDAGEVLVRTRDVRNGLFELTGGAVIRAARLRSAARANELLVSQSVYERASSTFRAEPLHARAFDRSLQGSVVYCVQGRVAPERKSDTRRTRILPARSELAELQRFWTDRAPERGGLMVVQGVAGSGKSRLLQSFVTGLPRDVDVYVTRGRGADSEPFCTLTRMTSGDVYEDDPSSSAHSQAPRSRLRNHALGGVGAGTLELADPGPSVATVDSEAFGQRSFHEWTEVLNELEPWHGASSTGVNDTQRLSRSIQSLSSMMSQRLEASSRRQVFVIDDLHWVDPSSLAVLSQLAGRLCSLGAVFVCAVRDDPEATALLERFCGAVPGNLSALIKLGPLTAADASHLVAEHLGLAPVSGEELIRRLASLGDGTPLNLIELLHMLLDGSYLYAEDGQWQLDAALFEGLTLAPDTHSLIERRVASVSEDANTLLRVAAIVHDSIDTSLLFEVAALDSARAQTALTEAVSARLLRLDATGQPSFTHDVIWEVVLHNTPEEEQRLWHKRAAQALRALPDLDKRQRFALARHAAAGLMCEEPQRTFEALRAAARLALAAHDDALALTFLEQAAKAAKLAQIEPGSAFHAELAETALRSGELQTAFEAFDSAARQLSPGYERAHLLGRMAWIRHFEGSGAATELLEEALRECGQLEPPTPEECTPGLRSKLARLATRLPHGKSALTRSQVETLCGLNTTLSRISSENGQWWRSLAYASRVVFLADKLPACRVRVRSDMMVGFYFGLTGARRLSNQRFERALATAEQLADPGSLAFYHQICSVYTAYQGKLEDADAHARQSVVVRGQYMELGELCLVCFGQIATELYRGRNERALEWAGHAIERVLQAGHAPAVFGLIEDIACGIWMSQGRQQQVVQLKSRLRYLKRTQLERTGHYHAVSYACRATHIATAEVPNPALETLIDDFGRLRLNPKRVPLVCVLFYVQVAYARLTQCLRAHAAERPEYLAKLRLALTDVDASTRLPLMEPHREVLRAAMRWFKGAPAEAENRLREAERHARDHGLPLASFHAARLRAHMLAAQNKLEAADDQARVAATYAERYGMLDLLRFVREEFPVKGYVDAHARDDRLEWTAAGDVDSDRKM